MAGINHKLRFEVLRRDSFTCRYCGRRAPYVHVEADHIVPRSQGGEDVAENLVCSCYDCNRGKQATHRAHSGLASDPTDFDMMKARLDKMVALQAVATEYAREVTSYARELDRYWWETLAQLPQFSFAEPVQAMLRYFVQRVPVEDLRECMAVVWQEYGDPKNIRPWYRLAWRRMEERTDDLAERLVEEMEADIPPTRPPDAP